MLWVYDVAYVHHYNFVLLRRPMLVYTVSNAANNSIKIVTFRILTNTQIASDTAAWFGADFYGVAAPHAYAGSSYANTCKPSRSLFVHFIITSINELGLLRTWPNSIEFD